MVRLAATLLLAAATVAPTVVAAQTAVAPPASAQRKTIARVSMFSSKPEALKKFYTDVLGFIPVWEGVIGEGANAEIIRKAWMLPPGARLNGALMRAPRGDMEFQVTYVTGAPTLKSVPRVRTAPPLSGDHYFVIHVPDLNAVVEKMKPYNIQYNRPPMSMTAIDKEGKSFSVYEAVIYDPEGTILILVQDV